jgi:site-specific recombinase XerD
VASPRLRDLIPSYGRHLRAEGKTTATVDHTYLPALERFAAFLEASGMPVTVAGVHREHLEAYLVSLQQAGKRPATVNLAYRSLAPFWRWAREEGEIKVSPMANMRPPVVPEQPGPTMEADQLDRLIRACSGSVFEDRRDLAVIMLLADTGMRRGELAGLTLDAIDLDRDLVVIAGDTSKSRRTRTVRFGMRTTKALDRYMRVRGGHPDAASTALWLGKRGPMTGSGILQVLERRGHSAGIDKLHPHLFRHAWAHWQLEAGASEGDLMQLGGWRDRGMLGRYGSSLAAERAIARYESPVDRLRDSGAARNGRRR